MASLDALLWRLSVPGVFISRGHAFYFRFVSLFHGSYSLSSAAVSKKYCLAVSVRVSTRNVIYVGPLFHKSEQKYVIL